MRISKFDSVVTCACLGLLGFFARPESVDPDMLDEMARSTLDVAKPNELIVLDSP